MQSPKQFRVIAAATALSLFAGCSNGPSGISPTTTSQKATINGTKTKGSAGYYSCPAAGAVMYLADGSDDTIDVFKGKLQGQARCGHITSALHNPQGLYVDPNTHDLYVANAGDQNVLVYHRGQTAPYNVYFDQYHTPRDVLVAKGGIVVDIHGAAISTWIKGPNGGTFVGRFPLKNHSEGLWIGVQKDGTLYYDDLNRDTRAGELWFLKCPGGRCHHQTQVAGVTFSFAGGVAVNSLDNVLVVSSEGPNSVDNTLQTFDLPNPEPSTFPLLNGWPMAMAINKSNQHVYVADAQNHNASEYTYPSGALVGTVTCCTGAPIGPAGIAVDP